MKAIRILIVLLLPGFSLFGQKIQVLDRSTSKPIPMVSVYGSSSQHNEISSPKGWVDISGFDEQDTLYFRLIGYEQKALSYSRVLGMEKVTLISKPFSLNEVVVSANQWEQSKKDVPNRITTIDRKNIQFQESQTSADVLGTSGEVYIQKSQLGGGSPMIRGFATNRVLLVVDGVRMNNAIFRSGNLQNVISVDPNAVEHSEVVFGPGSIIYGSDAIGGVMDFHTLEPDPSGADSMIASGNVLARYSSANNEASTHADIEIGGRNWASVTSISYSDFGHQMMGTQGPDGYLRENYVERINGRDTVIENERERYQIPTGYEQYNLLQKLRYEPTDSLDITFGFQYSRTTDIPRYDRLTEKENGQFRKAEWYYGPQVWGYYSLQADHDKQTFLYDRMKVTAYYQFFEESRHDRGFRSPWLRHRKENVNWGGFDLDMNKRVGEKSRLFYGVNVVRNLVHSNARVENIETGEAEAIGTRYPDGSTWDSYGAFLQFRHKFSRKLTLNVGARYDHVFLSGELDTSFYPFPFKDLNLNTGAPTGNLGLVYKPSSEWRIRLNGSTGFRAPNIDDAAKVFDSEPGSVVVPNDDLGSEYAYNTDLGVTKSFGDFLKMDVTGFYTFLDNAMVRREFQYRGRDSIIYDGTLSNVQATQNLGSVYVTGIQASISANLPKGFAFEGHYNYTYGETSDGKSIRHVAPPFGKASLSWEGKGLRTQFYVDWNQEIPFEDLAPSEKGKPHIYAENSKGRPYSPGWYTLNFKASYQMLGAISIGLGVENILDKRYRHYSSGIAAPGRNFIVSARGWF